jgi:long-chain acyl-CoA synthetase
MNPDEILRREREYTDHVIGDNTLPELFEASVQRYDDLTAQRYKTGVFDRTMTPDVLPSGPEGEFLEVSYERMGEIVRGLSYGFRELGVEKQDRVGIFANTRMEWAHTDFALLGIGAIITTVYTESSPDQARYLLDNSGSCGVVVEDQKLLDRILEVEDQLDLDFIVMIDDADEKHYDRDDIYSLADVYELGVEENDPDQPEDWIDDSLELDDLASLVYTSGTTARPKGVMLSHGNFRSSINQIRKRCAPRPDKGPDDPSIREGLKTLSFLPLAHVYERFGGHFVMFASGANVAYAEDPDTLKEDLPKVKPNMITSVPRVYERLFDGIREKASGSFISKSIFNWATSVGEQYARSESPGPLLKMKHWVADKLLFQKILDAFGGEMEFCISGGGSLSAELGFLFKGMGLRILEGYGLTESAPLVSVNPPEKMKMGTLGIPIVDIEIKVDNEPLTQAQIDEADGEIGELLIRGENVTEGYWEKPDATDEAFTEDGWFRTGDIIELRDDGYLEFHDRLKQLLVLSTGKNVAPQPIEGLFATSERVSQCMVVGDSEKFIAAIMVPNFEALEQWAEDQDVDLPDSREAICEDDRVNEWIQEEVDRLNQELGKLESIKKFKLVPYEWTPDNDLLTPSMKIKRRNVRDQFQDRIDEIYREAEEEDDE